MGAPIKYGCTHTYFQKVWVHPHLKLESMGAPTVIFRKYGCTHKFQRGMCMHRQVFSESMGAPTVIFRKYGCTHIFLYCSETLWHANVSHLLYFGEIINCVNYCFLSVFCHFLCSSDCYSFKKNIEHNYIDPYSSCQTLLLSVLST